MADCRETDRYGRAVCVVEVKGRDIGLEQVRNGFAWWYRKYSKIQTPEERANYEAGGVTPRVGSRVVGRPHACAAVGLAEETENRRLMCELFLLCWLLSQRQPLPTRPLMPVAVTESAMPTSGRFAWRGRIQIRAGAIR